jgi:hypothetical protein
MGGDVGAIWLIVVTVRSNGDFSTVEHELKPPVTRGETDVENQTIFDLSVINGCLAWLALAGFLSGTW